MDPVAVMLSSENDATMIGLLQSIGFPGLNSEMYARIKTIMLENPSMINAMSASISTAAITAAQPEPETETPIHAGVMALAAGLSAANMCTTAVQSQLDATEAFISAMEPSAMTEYQDYVMSKTMAAMNAMGIVSDS